MQELLPNGVLGIAVTGLLAAFMAGMAANVSSFNTVFTTDIWAKYVVRDREDAYYIRFGRMITVIGVLASIGTAFLASSFSNIMSYLQTLFSFFNVPMFAVFIVGMFWKRASVKSGFWGLLAGTTAAMVNYFVLYEQDVIGFPSDQGANFVSAIAGFVAGGVVMLGVSLFTAPKPAHELQGLVYGTVSPGMAEPPAAGDDARAAGLGRGDPGGRLLRPVLVLIPLRRVPPRFDEEE
jgi:SSS family solute:Na+ symporter